MKILKKQLREEETRTFSTINCETEFCDHDVTFCNEDFLSKVHYNPDFNNDIDEYLIEYLNKYEHEYCSIEGEDFGYLNEPMPDKLRAEAELRIKRSKHKYWCAK